MTSPYPYGDIARHEVIPFLPRDSRRMLDVGCGRGAFGELVKRALAAEVWGVDSSASVADHAQRRLDRWVHGEFDEVVRQLPAESFDVITFLDVLEHMQDPWGALQLARPLLTPVGHIIASVPNVRYWPVVRNLVLRGQWEYTDSGVLDRTHLRFYTRESLTDMFAKTGYEVQGVHGINAMRFRKLAVVNWMMLGRLTDMRYCQFLLVARPR